MYEEAKKKLREEIGKASDPYTKIVGEYVLKNIEVNKQTAELITEGKKSLEGSMKVVKAVAREKAVNGCAVMEDEEVFKLVRKYYEFDGVQTQITEEVKEETPREKDNVIYEDFNVSLEDFM